MVHTQFSYYSTGMELHTTSTSCVMIHCSQNDSNVPGRPPAMSTLSCTVLTDSSGSWEASVGIMLGYFMHGLIC